MRIGKCVSVLALALASAGGSTSWAALPEGAFGWMAELAGHCWTATYADGATRDTQCYSIQFDRYLRGTIEIASTGANEGRAPYLGDSLFVWEPDTRRMKFYYWSSGGSDGVAIGQVEGEEIRFPSPPRADPSAPPTRTTWRRLGPDSYRVTLQSEIGGEWQDSMSIVYSRVVPDGDDSP